MDGQFFRAQPIQFEGAPLPVLGIPKGADCTLLLHGNGADGSTTFTDSSASALSATAAGNVQIDTSQSKFGGASIQFDGTGDYLQYNAPAGLAYGTGAFTIDFWLRLSSSAGNNAILDTRPSVTNTAPYFVIYLFTNKMKFHSNGVEISSTTTLSTNTWYHVAITRSGSTVRLFINGTEEASGTYSNNFAAVANRPILGAEGFNLGNGSLPGWIDEFHVQKGTAKWTANFTPPSTPYF
jgi:hypothetical protein